MGYVRAGDPLRELFLEPPPRVILEYREYGSILAIFVCITENNIATSNSFVKF